MTVNRKIAIISSVIIFFALAGDAFALGAVSRACRFDDIPRGTKNFAARFFYAIGAPRSVLSIPDLPSEDQREKFILEAITTDYLRARYWLYAAASVSAFLPADPRAGQYYDKWDFVWTRYSPDWTPRQISDAMRASPYFAPYYLNRQVLFSSRAGDPEIVVDMESWVDSGHTMFRVKGYHYYYDPASKIVAQLPDTIATDCNLPNLGLSTPFNR